MDRSHEHVLADIEQVVRASGAALDEADARIAEVLGVPTDYYHAYLLVWGAIEAHAQARAGPPTQPATEHVPATPVHLAWLNRASPGPQASTSTPMPPGSEVLPRTFVQRPPRLCAAAVQRRRGRVLPQSRSGS